MRDIRQDGNLSVEKLPEEKKISEDKEKRAHDEIQKLTDGQCRSVTPRPR
jgi:ribosome recycling factor